MKVFFDEDNGTAIPRALRGVGAPNADILFPRPGGPILPGAPDVEWLEFVGRNGYLAISQNRHILDVPVEREALIRESCGVVFLANGEQPAYRALQLLLNRWDWLQTLDANETRPFAYILPFRGKAAKVI
ncbi:MAG: hypothetical protein HY875_13260 [Chloroflexi bacterium]|nr:hypothetical protein [Chloroflexota bacterium]